MAKKKVVYAPDQFPHPCSACGKLYDEKEWRKLKGGKTQRVPAGEDPVTEPAYTLEYRDCKNCKSTLVVTLAEAKGSVSGVVEDVEGVPPPVDDAASSTEQVQLIDGIVDDVKTRVQREKDAADGWVPGGREKRGEGKRLIDDAMAAKVGHKLELEEGVPVDPTPPTVAKPELDGALGVTDDEWADKLSVILADAVGESIAAQEQQELIRKFWHPGVKDSELYNNWWHVLHDVLGEDPDKSQMPFRARTGAVDILVRRSIADVRQSQGVTLHGLGAFGKKTPEAAMRHLADAMIAAASRDYGIADWHLNQALEAGASEEMVEAHRREFHRKYDEEQGGGGPTIHGLESGDHPPDHGQHHLDAAWVAAEDGDWARVEWQLKEALADGADERTVRQLDRQFQEMSQSGGLGALQDPAYRLIVKGDVDEARAAAQSRGIPVQAVKMIADGKETILRCQESYWPQINKWYGETLDSFPPYPKGTLLHYAVEQGPTAAWGRRQSADYWTDHEDEDLDGLDGGRVAKIRDLIRELKDAGFVLVRERGDHGIFQHEDGRSVSLAPMNPGREASPNVTRNVRAVIEGRKQKNQGYGALGCARCSGPCRGLG